MLIIGDMMSAAEAEKAGLVSKVFPVKELVSIENGYHNELDICELRSMKLSSWEKRLGGSHKLL